MIDFAFIAPTSVMPGAMQRSGCHMALQHLCHDEAYANMFLAQKGYVYLDNSQYELGEPCTVDELIIAGRRIQADCLILPDGSMDGIERIKKEGFDVMYIPAAVAFEEDFVKALLDNRIDIVGLSYSKTSQAMGLPRHDISSRFKFLQSVNFPLLPPNKIHMLGMPDSVHEIMLLKPYDYAIKSWDSSNAVWAGIKGRDVKHLTHKILDEVDFNGDYMWSRDIESNIAYTTMLLNL